MGFQVVISGEVKPGYNHKVAQKTFADFFELTIDDVSAFFIGEKNGHL